MQNQLRSLNPDPSTVLSITTRLMPLKKELGTLQARLREIRKAGICEPTEAGLTHLKKHIRFTPWKRPA